MIALSLDVGSTNLKGGIIADTGKILEIKSLSYDIKREDNCHYINIASLTNAVLELVEYFAKSYSINYVCISSMGESFVPISKSGKVLSDSILYSDARAKGEASELSDIFSRSKLIDITGLSSHSMYSLPKIMWIKKNQRDIFDKTDKFMLIGDYVGYLLSGESYIDYSLASRTLAFDVHKKEFSDHILSAVGIDKSAFSTAVPTGTIVAKVKSNLIKDCYLVSGGHDQICATIGAGAIEKGQAVNGLGTVECITPVFDSVPSQQFSSCGYALVPFLQDLYATYAFNMTGGICLQWLKEKLLCDNIKNFHMDAMANFPKEPTNLFVLPHFAGASTPYMDNSSTACILGLSLNTTHYDIYKAIMEGTSMEMKVNIEILKNNGIAIDKLVVCGGGSTNKEYLQTKADIYGIPIYPLQCNEAGLLGSAMLSFTASKHFSSLAKAKETMVISGEPFIPSSNQSFYAERFETYKKIYDTVLTLK